LSHEEAALVAEVVATSDNHSVRILSVAENYLALYKQQAVIDRIRFRKLQRCNFRLPQDIYPHKPSRDATEAFLDAVLAATNVRSTSTQERIDRPLLNLAALNEAMGLMKVPISDWYAIG